jgi:hypothetical protein
VIPEPLFYPFFGKGSGGSGGGEPRTGSRGYELKKFDVLNLLKQSR